MPRRFRVLAAVAFSGLCANAASAQDREAIQTGFLVGWSLSTISNLDTRIPNPVPAAQDLRTAYLNHSTYGVFVRIPLTSLLAFEPEIISVTKGATNVERTGSIAPGAKPQSAGVSLAYFEVPLLLRIASPVEFGRVRPFALVGTSGGFQLNCQYHAKVTNFDGFSKCDSHYGRWEVGAVASAGLSAVVSRRKVSGQFRFTQGLNNIAPSTSVGSERNRVMSILFGIELL